MSGARLPSPNASISRTGAWRGSINQGATVRTPGVEDAASSFGDSGKVGDDGEREAAFRDSQGIEDDVTGNPAAGEERVEDILPGVPTLEELGLDWTSHAILGLFAPADTPDEVIRHLNGCLDEARVSESFSGYMDNLGFTQEYKDADAFDAFLREEHQRYGAVVDDAGLGHQ